MDIKAILGRSLPSGKSASLAALSAVLLVIAFPNFGIASFAWLALVPLFFAIRLESDSFKRSFATGWIFGTVFFFGTCWWLTFAPITYAGFPTPIAYFLLLCVTAVAGVFPALAGAMLGASIRRFGEKAVFVAPVFWVGFEFVRYWLTGNNWNTIGYSQAFNVYVELGSIGGVHIVSFLIVTVNALLSYALFGFYKDAQDVTETDVSRFPLGIASTVIVLVLSIIPFISGHNILAEKPYSAVEGTDKDISATVIAIQPNIPMAGLDRSKWNTLRAKQAQTAEKVLSSLALRIPEDRKITVILPESPMNFRYEEDAVFRSFINTFARRNNVSVLFNSAEPDKRRPYGYFNSAVLVSNEGKKVDQYDKIHLLPFGEFVPLPEFAQSLIPPMVGRYSFGEEYDLLPFGDAKAGIMICFESHFPSLSRRFVNDGADVLIEMTNDGYLGPTPVLKQHLASAAFRAAETNRPLLRVTNVGVTAYIDESGAVFDAADDYVEATRVWNIRKSDGKGTLYLMFGDWLAWLCLVMSLVLGVWVLRKGNG